MAWELCEKSSNNPEIDRGGAGAGVSGGEGRVKTKNFDTAKHVGYISGDPIPTVYADTGRRGRTNLTEAPYQQSWSF